MIDDPMLNKIRRSGVIAVLTVDDTLWAVPLA